MTKCETSIFEFTPDKAFMNFGLEISIFKISIN